jgi:hypothetical protein
MNKSNLSQLTLILTALLKWVDQLQLDTNHGWCMTVQQFHPPMRLLGEWATKCNTMKILQELNIILTSWHHTSSWRMYLTTHWYLSHVLKVETLLEPLKCNFNHFKYVFSGEFEYDLELKFDHNCPNQYSQWFFFKITNTKRKNVSKLIANLCSHINST